MYYHEPGCCAISQCARKRILGSKLVGLDVLQGTHTRASNTRLQPPSTTLNRRRHRRRAAPPGPSPSPSAAACKPASSRSGATRPPHALTRRAPWRAPWQLPTQLLPGGRTRALTRPSLRRRARRFMRRSGGGGRTCRSGRRCRALCNLKTGLTALTLQIHSQTTYSFHTTILDGASVYGNYNSQPAIWHPCILCLLKPPLCEQFLRLALSRSRPSTPFWYQL